MDSYVVRLRWPVLLYLRALRHLSSHTLAMAFSGRPRQRSIKPQHLIHRSNIDVPFSRCSSFGGEECYEAGAHSWIRSEFDLQLLDMLMLEATRLDRALRVEGDPLALQLTWALTGEMSMTSA